MKRTLLLLAVAGLVNAESRTEMSNRASQMYVQAHYKEAEALYRKALDGWDDRSPDSEHAHVIAIENLGALLRATGRYAEAEPLLREGVTRLEGIAPGTLDLGRALDNLAALYRAESEYDKAEECALRAAKFIPDDMRLDNRLVLASIYLDQHRAADAKAALTPLPEAANGNLAAALYNDLAAIALLEADYVAAEQHATKALEFAQTKLGHYHPSVAAAYNNLAQAFRFEQRYVEAEESYRNAIEVWRGVFGEKHPDYARGLLNLAAFYHERRREAGAEDLYRRAVAIFEQSLGPQHPQTIGARERLADVLRAEKRYTEATRLVKLGIK